MIDERLVPSGFRAVAAGRSVLIADRGSIDRLVEAGLDRVDGWRRLLRNRSAGPSRGRTGRLALSAGGHALVKQLRRGGLAQSILGDRFFGARRLIANLTLPLEAARRGVATAAPVALLVEPSVAGLYRGWLAVEEIDGARDLARAAREPRGLERDGLRAVMAQVRAMHEAGIDHRDLNAGNLLLRRGDSGHEAFVIDLDRARIASGEVPLRLRAASLRRLERSIAKWVMDDEWASQLRDWIYDDYAGSDAALRAKLGRARAWVALRIRLRRRGWRAGRSGRSSSPSG